MALDCLHQPRRAGLFAPVHLFMIPSINPRPGIPFQARVTEMDRLGIVLFIGAFVMGVMTIALGRFRYIWDDSRIIA